MITISRTPTRSPRGLEPLSPQRKWRAITVATLLLAFASWSVLAGMVTYANDDGGGVANPAAAIALGLALIPFVFMLLAFLSEHPQAPAAVAKAMAMAVVIGIPVSAIAIDGVTGIVAGVGAGGVLALRADEAHSTKRRVLAVVAATLYVFVLVRIAGPIALLAAPVLPFTGLGLADHWSERRTALSASSS